MAYKLVVSFNNNEGGHGVAQRPPDFGPEVEQRNGTYEGISGDFNTLGPMGLRSIPLSSFFPVGRRYPFMPPEAETDGWKYVAFIQRGAGAAHPLPGDPAGQLRPVPPEYGLLH